MKIMERVLNRIVPDTEEQGRIERAVAALIARVEEIARQLQVGLKPLMVGSIAKGTHLKSPDIDLFLKFPVDFAKDEMENIDKAIGRAILDDPEERYAEHPYISGFWQGFRTDLVPCFEVLSGSGKISAVDRTPFHTDFIVKHMSPEKRDEVRLLKQFMKGISSYGAEAKVQGFSGYLCELLILKFESFEGVMASARKWALPMELWIEKKGAKEFEEAFIFIDPVDPGRNVASAVSSDKLNLFIDACRTFKERPSEKYFFPNEQEPWDDAKLAAAIQMHRGTVLVELPPLRVVDDVLWPQLRKTGRSIFETLEREGFKPRKITLQANSDMNLITVECQTAELSPTLMHLGPSEKSREAQNFLRKWSGKGISEPASRQGRWQVEIERELRTPKDVLLKRFKSVGVGKGFRKVEAPVIVSGEELMKPKYRRILTKHFDERKPWER